MGVMICDEANLERLNGHCGYKNKCQIDVFVGLFHVIPKQRLVLVAGQCFAIQPDTEMRRYHSTMKGLNIATEECC